MRSEPTAPSPLLGSPGAIVRRALSGHLHFDDPWVVDVALATIVGNALDGDPLWLLLVNPASSGKTELVQMFRHVPSCEWLAELSENTFLSGLKRPAGYGPRGSAREHSLLFRWTDPVLRGDRPPARMMLVQDLTGLITAKREKRDALFGQLRQIYDGRLVKATGMGDDLIWEGYLGLLGAVTPKIDDVAELNSTLGERFLLYRPTRTDAEAEARAALARGADENWRTAVAETTCKMVARAILDVSCVAIPDSARDCLIDLAVLTALGRAAVERDGYTKRMRTLPEPEGPARLVQQLTKLLRGLCAVCGKAAPEPRELAIVGKAAGDSIPKIRRITLAALYAEPAALRDLAQRVSLPRPTVTYLVEDLNALGVTKCEGDVVSLEDEFRALAEQSGFLGAAAVTKRKGNANGEWGGRPNS
jgi:hypothetical protein